MGVGGFWPHSWPRLVVGGIVVAVVGVVVAVVVTTRASSSANKRAASTSTTYPAPHKLGKAGTYPTYGMTRRQVEHFTGAPTKIQGACWVFRPTIGTQDGKPTLFVGTMMVSFPGGTDVPLRPRVKLCFYEGKFSESYKQLSIHGTFVWDSFPPGGPTVDACADPSACVAP